MIDRQYQTLQGQTAEPTQHLRWVNETPERLLRASQKGYKPVLRDGQVVRQAVGAGLTAILMEIPKVKRNLDAFFAKRKGMSANVKARILRLNPTIEEGGLIRGWHPWDNARARLYRKDLIGKGTYIRTYGREAFEEMKDAGYVVKEGKREYVTREGLMDAPRAKAANDSDVVQDFMRRKR